MKPMTTRYALSHHYARHVDMRGFDNLSPAVYRASTITFKTLDEFVERKQRIPDGYTYGITGTPTHRQLEIRIAELDKAAHCLVVPSGQAAISLTMLSLLKAGDHLLISDSAYGPALDFSRHLASMGIDIERYDPRAGGAIADQIRASTRLIWLEAPGSMSMEVQDIQAIAAVAQARGVLTAMDNTWATPLYFSPLSQGVDICIHACSKYMGGHADLLMGSISTNRADLYRTIRAMQSTTGMSVSAGDCFLVQRGLDTMPLRVQRQSESALALARRLQAHPMVAQVLHPALPGFETHDLWKRQFSGSGSLFSVVFKAGSLDAYRAMFDALRTIMIGASYGSPQTLIAFYPAALQQSRSFPFVDAPIVRLAVGLEDCDLLWDDLAQSLDVLAQVESKHLNKE